MPTPPLTRRTLQPLLHDLSVVVHAPAMAVARTDGDIRAEGAQGLWVQDHRVISRFELTIDGQRPESVGHALVDTSASRHDAVCRTLGDPIPDPTVRCRRLRTVQASGMVDRVTLESSARAPVRTTLQLAVGADAATLALVKGGGDSRALDTTDQGWGLAMAGPAATTRVSADPSPDLVDGDTGTLTWDVWLAPGATWTVTIGVDVAPNRHGPFTAPLDRSPPWCRPSVASPNPSIPALADRGFHDLTGLLLADHDGDRFVAAGAPWFLTLFGRDSLWAARMLLPFGTDLALSTLRALARRQGVREDPNTEEQPGKVLHEVRAGEFVVDDLDLPAQYYGTIDATPLWVIVLVDAWRWGCDPDAVRALLPSLRAALEWILNSLATSSSGLLQYVDHGGSGLSNQGWKDSADSVQFADGRLAQPPLALVEPQAYAHEALLGAARLLDALGEPGSRALRDQASTLAERVRRVFWVDGGEGRHLAIALDRDGTPVNSLTSNAGHALGTGILSPAEAIAITSRLVRPDMSTRFGLRTLTSTSPRFGVLSYHGGTIWPHDTAIVAAGMAREGHLAPATTLALGLVDAGPGFAHRLPELFGVTREPQVAIAYPAACRPQAWAATAPLWALVHALGVRADAPGGVLDVPAHVDERLTGLVVDPVTIGGDQVRLAVGQNGRLVATPRTGAISVHVRHG